MDLLKIMRKPGIDVTVDLHDIFQCNEISKRYGLLLSKEEALELLEVRNQALVDNGRIELNIEAVKKIITAFCSSPNIDFSDYGSVLWWKYFIL